MKKMNGKYVLQYFKDQMKLEARAEAKLEANKETALNLYYEGDSVTKIARVTGRTKAEVQRWINEIQPASV